MVEWRGKERGERGAQHITHHPVIKEENYFLLYGGSRSNKLSFPSIQPNQKDKSFQFDFMNENKSFFS